MLLTQSYCCWAVMLSLAAGFLVLSVPAQAQLVANDGFETADLTGWTLSGNADYTSLTPNTFVFGAPQPFLSASYSLSAELILSVCAGSVPPRRLNQRSS